jgi:hypothetical protein
MSYVTILTGWLEPCGCGRFGAGHTRQEHLSLAAETEGRSAAFTPDGSPNLVGVRRPAGQAHLMPRAAVVGNAETLEAVAGYLERVERADARLRQAQQGGADDSWYEEDA